MLKIIAIILICLITTLGILSWFGGEFDTITIKKTTIGPYYVVSRSYQGRYSGFRFLIKNVAEYVQSKTPDTIYRGFAVFYDDPSEASSDSLRFAAGIILDKKIEVDTPYNYILIDSTEALVGEYPIRSFFSYVKGYGKFTETLEKYIKKNQTVVVKPFFEMYNMREKKIYYIAPIGYTSPVPSFNAL
jgi:DNA gyrase inhibitor GyrI